MVCFLSMLGRDLLGRASLAKVPPCEQQDYP